MRRQDVDDWLPTVTRCTGLVVTVALIVLTSLGHALEAAPAWPAAAGLLLYRGNSAKNGGGGVNPANPGTPPPPRDESLEAK